ncbi:hypothetical protein OG478_20090 [Streptomyces phaeochromogenes]|uniref:hypothetical protein n=1 Tax=Streptomyces phaeochromogenes TaxID=1923 RepID=UPI003866A7B5|nr:hypothetical protein OG478_20090 [Streptomyces phaeochromogenes]
MASAVSVDSSGATPTNTPLPTRRIQTGTSAVPFGVKSWVFVGPVGCPIGTALWDGRSTAAEFAADVRSMTAQRTPVNFAAFETGTVVPAGSTTSAHMATWQVAYTIPGIRDWIMRQSR